jgi:hypothetical protein
MAWLEENSQAILREAESAKPGWEGRVRELTEIRRSVLETALDAENPIYTLFARMKEKMYPLYASKLRVQEDGEMLMAGAWRLDEAAAKLNRPVQRLRLTGGTCEATAYLGFGYEAGGLAIPLVNYHNGLRDGAIAAEKVRLSDVAGAVALLLEAARQRRVLLDVLPVRGERRSDDRAELPAREERVQGLAELLPCRPGRDDRAGVAVRARAAIVAAGYPDSYRVFTHRLGHGIGLDGHEHPYLVRGSRVVLQPGMTFSNEPGIYVKDDYGLRLEDIIVIEPEGQAGLLTPRFSSSLENPCG